MELDYKMIGQRIRSRRKELHLTQEQLAERANRSFAFIGHIERGTRIMSVATLYEMALALDCTTDELLGLEHKEIDTIRDVRDLLEMAQCLLQEKESSQRKTS